MARRLLTGFMTMLFILLSLFGCDRTLDIDVPESEPEGEISITLENGNVELGNNLPDSWFPYIWGSNNYEMSWTTEDYHSPSHSLKMSLDTYSRSGSFAFWVQNIPLDAPFQNDLTITAHMKLENIVGDGVALFMQLSSYPDQLQGSIADSFYVSQNNVPVSGTKNWDEYRYSVSASDIPPNIEYIDVILLFLPKSTGTVYFDDITLLTEE